MPLRRSEKRWTFRIDMSLSMWMVHFRPRTPRLVAIGQPIIGADVAIGVPLVQYSKGS